VLFIRVRAAEKPSSSLQILRVGRELGRRSASASGSTPSSTAITEELPEPRLPGTAPTGRDKQSAPNKEPHHDDAGHNECQGRSGNGFDFARLQARQRFSCAHPHSQYALARADAARSLFATGARAIALLTNQVGLRLLTRVCQVVIAMRSDHNGRRTNKFHQVNSFGCTSSRQALRNGWIGRGRRRGHERGKGKG
jgi:hypothetical protein